jgi:hypothetical protein
MLLAQTDGSCNAQAPWCGDSTSSFCDHEKGHDRTGQTEYVVLRIVFMFPLSFHTFQSLLFLFMRENRFREVTEPELQASQQ